jgi:sigma-B regulation protein RsbU (phosphoserine phosphatase)
LAALLAEKIGPAWATIERIPAGILPADLIADAVLVDLAADDVAAMERTLGLAARLRDTSTAMIVIDGRLAREKRIALYRAGVLGFLTPGEDAEEMTARLASLGSAKRMAAHAIGRLREHSRQMDEQLRLAQRLQMDFLPRRMPEVSGARFAARLEAAAWVAGDFYDVFRLDERHVGFYVADAVGHGVPAALLTVFVKKSLKTKRIEGHRYELIAPDEALRLLNVDLLSAELQETPFITMLYGIYDELTGECAYARAGHPKPIVLEPAGTLRFLEGDGPLLGIFGDATFELCRTTLRPGQRLLFYTDGAERVVPVHRASPARLFEIMASASLLPLEALVDAIFDSVRAATGGDRLADDVTLVAMEVEDPTVLV